MSDCESLLCGDGTAWMDPYAWSGKDKKIDVDESASGDGNCSISNDQSDNNSDVEISVTWICRDIH
jgi:hypothetical protein